MAHQTTVQRVREKIGTTVDEAGHPAPEAFCMKGSIIQYCKYNGIVMGQTWMFTYVYHGES